MTDSAWAVVNAAGETVAAHWFREWAEEYIEEQDYPPGMTVVEVPLP